MLDFTIMYILLIIEHNGNVSNENSAIHEMTWENIVRPDRPQLTIWRMRIARCITKSMYSYLWLYHVDSGYANARQYYV